MLSRLLQDLATAQAERRPGATALAMDDARLTYADVETASNQLANALREIGCRPRDRVCLLLPKSPWAVLAMLAVLKAGCVYVPVGVASPAARVARVIASCEPAAILAAGAGGTLVEQLSATALAGAPIPIGWLDRAPLEGRSFAPSFDLAAVRSLPATAPAAPTRSSHPAHILFTSGSTGQPKGVVITHDNVLAFVDWATRHFGMGPSDRVSGHSPLHFDLSTFDVYGALAAGAELHLVPPELNLLPHRLAQLIRDRALTQWFSVPAALGYMALHDAVAPGDFPSLKRVLWCGEVLPTPVLIHWMRRLPHVAFTNLYGPTEATIASSYHDVTACPDDERASIPIGTPCTGEALLVLDADLARVPAGEIGDLHIAGAGLSPGYWRDPESTARAFLHRRSRERAPQRVYRTGDLAKVGRDGLVYFVGRADTQIKCRGYRVELGDVESALHAVTGVAEKAVVALPTGGFEGTVICCAFVPAPGSAITPAALRGALARSLPSYMLPSRWMQLDALPRNGNGKIDRPALVQRFRENAAAVS